MLENGGTRRRSRVPSSIAMTMLIVDDSARMRATIRSMLALREDEVVECGDGQEAVRLYRLHRPEWVLMDISMPVMDGILATASICEIEPAARVVIVTDHDDAAVREAARRAGAVGFVSKDDLSDLVEIVRR
jgi:DNA-binding NarL/FixJ family response regulator